MDLRFKRAMIVLVVLALSIAGVSLYQSNRLTIAAGENGKVSALGFVVPCHPELGGAQYTAESGCTVNVQSGATLKVDSGATETHANTESHTGAVTQSGALTVNNNATITGTLGVTGAQTFTGAATHSGAVTINNNATVTGTLALGANNATFTGPAKWGTQSSYTSGASITHGFAVTPTVCMINPSAQVTATYTITAIGFSSNMATTASPIYWLCGQ